MDQPQSEFSNLFKIAGHDFRNKDVLKSTSVKFSLLVLKIQ